MTISSDCTYWAVANVMAECYLLQKLLEQMTGLRVVPDKSSRVLGSTPKSIFSHHSTGKSFLLFCVNVTSGV